MEPMDSVCEGYFLGTEEGLLFEVKGSVHPRDRYIAYLRYIPDTYGIKESASRKGYTKIYDLRERERFLQSNHPYYLWFDRCNDRWMQAVPHEKIDFILSPIDAARQLRDKGRHLMDLERSTVDLIDVLVNATDLQGSSIGVTGSQLAGLATRDSDIDLVIFGEDGCKKFYDALKTEWGSISGLQRYVNSNLERHTTFRWGKQNQWSKWLQQREQSKLLQGMYEDFDFFIRLVKLPNEIGWKYGDRISTFVNEEVVRCLITDHSQGMFTPCEYSVHCEDHPELSKIISFRGRFTEHVDEGMVVEARGRLESIEDKQCIRSQHLVLGEKSTDYLIPIELL